MKRLGIILSIILILCLNAAVIACPMCKDSVPNSDAQSAGGLPGGFNTSVYLILGTFLGVLTLVLGGIWKAVQTTPNSRPRAGGFPIKPNDHQ
ncbi:MAG TPA: hypothetical protein VGP94_14335 [Tepidisphaeraceae bacterium]|jgi:hypothetical protein|nr:hypothetical protein [Tepidisphaeraceae bacterium]